MSAEEGLDEIRSRLEAIAEQLADLSRSHLSRALQDDLEGDEDGRSRATAQERRLAGARRAVLKAVTALGGTEED